MSNDPANPLGVILGYALLLLYFTRRRTPRSVPPHPTPQPRPLITPPPAVFERTDTKATLHWMWPLPAREMVVPFEQWRGSDELVAWRFWKLGRHWDGGARLLSVRAPYAWNGPVLRAHRLPSESPFSSAGVYALKVAPPGDSDVHWSEECWVSGWVALSGRVVEHEHGYRAERVVIRALRLGLGTHLRVTEMTDLLALAADLERRYRAPVDLGAIERRYAQRVLKEQGAQWGCGVPGIPQGVRVE